MCNCYWHRAVELEKNSFAEIWAEYMASRDWRLKRVPVFGRAEGWCEVCSHKIFREVVRAHQDILKRFPKLVERFAIPALKITFARATQVNHRTYQRRFHEPLEDLEAICRECHLFKSAMTDRDRAKDMRLEWDAWARAFKPMMEEIEKRTEKLTMLIAQSEEKERVQGQKLQMLNEWIALHENRVAAIQDNFNKLEHALEERRQCYDEQLGLLDERIRELKRYAEVDE